MINKYIFLFLISQCILFSTSAQQSYQEIFCTEYDKKDSFCIFNVPVSDLHKKAKIQPNIFDDLEQHFTISGKSRKGKYRIIIQMVAFNERVFFDSLKIDNCENPLHIAQITSIVKSSYLRFIDNDFGYLKNFYNYPNRSVFVFYLTPK